MQSYEGHNPGGFLSCRLDNSFHRECPGRREILLDCVPRRTILTAKHKTFQPVCTGRILIVDSETLLCKRDFKFSRTPHA